MNAMQSARAPLYPLPYAARLAGLSTKTARRWLHGYSYTRDGAVRQSAPVLPHHGPASAANDVLTFEQLLTLRLVRAFREQGRLGLPTIKAAARLAARRYQLGNPFISEAFRSDGQKIFIELRDTKAVPGRERLMVEALTEQQQFRELVEPSLLQNVVFFEHEPAEWWPEGLERSVVIRPDRAFGAPHIAGTGIWTEVAADAVAAEGGTERAVAAVAAFMGLTEGQVRDAVMAEARWRQPRAA